MTDIEITPEILRANASFLEENRSHGGAALLRMEAARIEREQADDKRIDELAQIHCTMRNGGDISPWPIMSGAAKERERASIRAVLAKLEQDEAAEARAAFGDEQCTMIRFDENEPGRETVYTTGSGYGDPGADPANEWDRGPWQNLRHVPAGVHTVYDRDGDEYTRDAESPSGWRINGNPYSTNNMFTAFSPFTLTRGGDQ